jgi:two-component system sensor histidine kinase KdpD
LTISECQLRDAAVQGTAFHDPAAGISVLPVSLGGGSIGSLAICGSAVSETALHAIANLAAIAVERARAQEVASRAEAARQHEKLKSTLLDALAHEFTTPLTSIKAAASAIVDEDRTAQKELGSIIEEEADRLTSLVTETIQMARIEAGNLRLHKQRQSVTALIASALDHLKVFLEDREVRVDIPEHLPEVAADPELIGLTVRQLLTNALKYSNPEAPITVQACADQAGVTISVRDCGPGIPEKELARIFDRFYRVADSARVPGIGLGLTIAREIVEAHGGRIWAESKPGQGSQFFLALPRGRDQAL